MLPSPEMDVNFKISYALCGDFYLPKVDVGLPRSLAEIAMMTVAEGIPEGVGTYMNQLPYRDDKDLVSEVTVFQLENGNVKFAGLKLEESQPGDDSEILTATINVHPAHGTSLELEATRRNPRPTEIYPLYTRKLLYFARREVAATAQGFFDRYLDAA